MTNEEIAKEMAQNMAPPELGNLFEDNQNVHPWVLSAMDEYAKQQAIAFDKWKWENRWWSFENGKWHYTFEQGTYMSKATLEKNYQKTTEQLYNQFIEQQNK